MCPPPSPPVPAAAAAAPCDIQFLDERLEESGVPYSYGFAIILLTIMVKVATFPLSQKQVRHAVRKPLNLKSLKS